MSKPGKNSKRPGKPLYRCEWRNVVALNFDVDPKVVQPFIPSGAQMERYHDHTLVTLMTKNIREFQPYGRSFTMFRSIHEIDLRTYIRWKQNEEIYRGHIKIKNLVSNKLAKRAFKFLTGQAQEFATINAESTAFEEARQDALPAANCKWNAGDAKGYFSVRARNAARKSEADSKEDFVLRQLNRIVHNPKGTYCFPIRQAPWLVWTASSGAFDCDTELLFGRELRKCLSKPAFGVMSRGGEVTVLKPWRIG